MPDGEVFIRTNGRIVGNLDIENGERRYRKLSISPDHRRVTAIRLQSKSTVSGNPQIGLNGGQSSRAVVHGFRLWFRLGLSVEVEVGLGKTVQSAAKRSNARPIRRKGARNS
jgi:hypothetical protein